MGVTPGRTDATAAGGHGDSDKEPQHVGAEPQAGLSDKDQALRTRVIDHCRFMWGFDRTYANAAYDRYREQLYWLELPERKR